MELLEREEALAALAEARDAAARGEGRVVFVTGEPGIGKTSLVTRFLAGARRRARGCCSAPATTSRSRARSARSATSSAASRRRSRRRSPTGAAPHEIQTLLSRSSSCRRGRPCSCSRTCTGPTTRRFDAITVLGRRIGSLPALLVLTFRAGEAPPGHPLHATVGAIRADDSRRARARRRSRRAPSRRSPATARARCTRATAGNPFYVTELRRLAGRRSTLPPSVANAVLGRAAAARRRLAPAGRARLGRAEPRARVAARRGDAGLARRRGGAGAAAAARGRRRVRPLPPRAGAARDPVERPDRARGAGCTPRSSRPCSPRTPTRPTSSTTPRPRAPRTSSPSTRSSPRAGRPSWSRTARRTPTTAAPRSSSTGCRAPEPGERARGAGDRGLRGRPARRRVRRRSSARSRSTASSATTRRSAAARALLSRYHWVTGDGDAARDGGARGDRDPRAARPVGRARPRLQRRLPARDARRGRRSRRSSGASARSSSRPGSATSGRARTRSSTSAARGSTTNGETATLLEAHAVADAAGDRHEAARALDNLGHSLLCWVRPDEALRYAQQAAAYGTRARAVHHRVVRRARSSPGCGCAQASGRRPSG